LKDFTSDIDALLEREAELAWKEPDSFGDLTSSFPEMHAVASDAVKNRTLRLQSILDEMAQKGVHYKGRSPC
jgi:hypothetical protein